MDRLRDFFPLVMLFSARVSGLVGEASGPGLLQLYVADRSFSDER